MIIKRTPIEGVVVVETTRFLDHRGAFERLFCDRELAAVLCTRRVAQINHSRTQAVGAVRGMHYQTMPHAEMKLVRCLRGRVWDVAVDLRRGSTTFMQWHAVELSAAGPTMMVIPEGCAHGFQVVEPDSELLYLHTAHYEKSAEGGIRHDDPRLGIDWPQPVRDLSARDAAHVLLDASFGGLETEWP